MRILLCLSHSIEEYDQLQLLSELGYETVSIGSYIDPRHPHDPKRPPADKATYFPEMHKIVDEAGGATAAQRCIPDGVLEWLGDDCAIILHHYLERFYSQETLWLDWKPGSSGRRIISRTVGQNRRLEELMAEYYRRSHGMEIVRYSPKERNIPSYAGEDALIRFYKDPDEWKGWSGDLPAVVNITQDMKQRDVSCNYKFWRDATVGLRALQVGPGSEEIGGVGEVTLEQMQGYLRTARAYCYTGTQPAPITLGLVEALITGVPVVSIGPSWMTKNRFGPDIFEGHELAALWSDNPLEARKMLQELLDDKSYAESISTPQRQAAIRLFGKEKIKADWSAYLG